jgi:hypothetical protein
MPIPIPGQTPLVTSAGVPGQEARPLDARKKALMVSTRGQMRADRAQQLVAVVTVQPAGGQGTATTAYVVLSGCVFREHMHSDQTLAVTEGTVQIDALVELPLTDPLTGATSTPDAYLYLANTGQATAAGVLAAEKYEIVSWKRGGMITNRYVCQLRRLR